MNVAVWFLVTIISPNAWPDVGRKVITGADDDAPTTVTTSLLNVTTNVCDDYIIQTIYWWHLCLVIPLMWTVTFIERRILFVLSFYCRWVELIFDNQSRYVRTSIEYVHYNSFNTFQIYCFMKVTVTSYCF